MTTIFEGYERKAGSLTSERTGELIDYTVEGAEGVTGRKTGEAKIKTSKLTVHGVKTLEELIGKPVILALDTTSKSPMVTDIYLVGG